MCNVKLKRVLWKQTGVVLTAVLLLASCVSREEVPGGGAGLPGEAEAVFRLCKSDFPVSGMPGEPAWSAESAESSGLSGLSGMSGFDGRYDRVYHYLTDAGGRVLENVRSYYDAAAGTIRAEGLHEGEYRLLVLAIDGDAAADGAEVREISRADEVWIVFPESLDAPLEAEYFHSSTPFSVSVRPGADGQLEEVALVPDRILQQRIISRIDFDFSFRNQQVSRSVVSKTARLESPRFCRTFTGSGVYGGETDGTDLQIDLERISRCRFLPLAAGTECRGTVEMQTVNYLDEHLVQNYGFVLDRTEPNRVHRVVTEVRHPDDRLATMYLTEEALAAGDFSRILQDDEPVAVYTDRNQRSFNTSEPLQASVTEDGRLHIRFYSPRDLHGVLIQALLPGAGEEYADLAYFRTVPAFGDFYETLPLTQGPMMVRTESGRYLEVGQMTPEQCAGMPLRIVSDDPYWTKIQEIEHGWTLYWGLFGGDPSREDGGPVGNWMGIRPVHCRESVAFFLNFTYMIDMPEHEAILRENADQLYDDNKQPVKVEEVLAKMRRNQTLQVGLVYPGNGVIGLGSPSVFGAYQRGWYEHYFNTYACSVMFHELGHVMGYGHASSFTYGPWAEQLMNNFYVDNLGKMPIDGPMYLNSAQNPNSYR